MIVKYKAKEKKMLVKRMSAREARNNFSDLLGMVYYSRKPVIVEKRGKPVAVMVNLEDYDQLLAKQKERFSVFDKVRAKNLGTSSQKIEEDAEREIIALRKKKKTKAKKNEHD